MRTAENSDDERQVNHIEESADIPSIVEQQTFDAEKVYHAGGYYPQVRHYSTQEHSHENLDFSLSDQIGISNKTACCILSGVVGIVILIVCIVLKQGTVSKSETPAPDPSHYAQKGYEVVTDGRGSQYTILAIYDREPIYYTQGLYFVDSTRELLESAGYWGKSRIQYLKKTEPEAPGTHGSISVRSFTPISLQEFAEGCTMVEQNGKKWIYQLTYTTGNIFRFNEDLTLDKTFRMPGDMQQGWGLSHNPANQSELYATDSGANIFTLALNEQGTELKVVAKKTVTNKSGYPINSLNELEHTGRTLFSNVYLFSNIELIDMATGVAKREIDMSRLVALATEAYLKKTGNNLHHQQCLNGIAYDKQEDVFYLTGKEWPLVFKIKFPREYYD